MKRWGRVIGMVVVAGLVLSLYRMARAVEPYIAVTTSDGGIMVNNPASGDGFAYVDAAAIAQNALKDQSTQEQITGAKEDAGTSVKQDTAGWVYTDQKAEAGGPRISGFYQAPNGKYYKIGYVKPPASGDEDGGGGGPRCACGHIRKECTRGCDGNKCKKTCEQDCSKQCAPPTCGTSRPEITQTSAKEGYFYVYTEGVKGGETNQAYHGPSVFFDVKSPNQSSATRYNGIRYAEGKFYAKINLANHPGYGKIYVWVTARNWPYGLYTACPRADFVRVTYVSGKVYYDPDNKCSTARPWTNTRDLVAAYSHGGLNYGEKISTETTTKGYYAIPNVTGHSVAIQLVNIPSGYQCSSGAACSANCPIISNAGTSSTNNNFFLADAGDEMPWWQVEVLPKHYQRYNLELSKRFNESPSFHCSFLFRYTAHSDRLVGIGTAPFALAPLPANRIQHALLPGR